MGSPNTLHAMGDKVTGLVFVDTDILIDLGRGIDEAVACLHTIEQQRPMAIAIVTQMELKSSSSIIR